jgi:N-acyl-D-amino-acid deacylase
MRIYDTLIRGGMLVDGTGAAPRSADVAIQNGRIGEIGQTTAPAQTVIEAEGMIVTPGFVDIHTHYDGQFLWDDTLDPSFSHGVTTVIAGNCGVGFAPVRPEHRRELIELMEGVEDIPGVTLTEGLDWQWRSFPDYLDRLAARSYTMDIAMHMTHAPLRVFVMGERALRHEDATPEDIAEMCALTREAMRAGAIGFSSSRILEHRSSNGSTAPGTFATEDEMVSLAKAMGESGHGVFQVIPAGSVGAAVLEDIGSERRLEEHRLMEKIVEAAARPLTYSLTQYNSDPGNFEMMLEASTRAFERGLPIYPQFAARGIGLVSALDGYHVFLMKPSYNAIAHLPLSERVTAMRDPERRQAILGEADVEDDFADQPPVLGMLRRMHVNLPSNYVPETPLDYEPGADRLVSALASAQGKTPHEFLYDHYTQGDGHDFNLFFGLNFAHASLDFLQPLFAMSNVLTGLGDGGAHVKMVTDAALPTFQLAFWARSRSRGPKVPIETMVNKLSGAPAAVYGLHDRGTITLGKRADINVIDLDRLMLRRPQIQHDLPSGGPRIVQRSTGYVATLVAGVQTRSNDADTGARPGRLVRSAAPTGAGYAAISTDEDAPKVGLCPRFSSQPLQFRTPPR